MASIDLLKDFRNSTEFSQQISDPSTHWMLKIAENVGYPKTNDDITLLQHPELVHQYDYWSVVVQPEKMRQSMNIKAAGMLVARAFIDLRSLFVSSYEQLPNEAKIEYFDICRDAAKRLVEQLGADKSALEGYDIGYHSESLCGVDIKSVATGRSQEPLHIQLLPKTESDIRGGVLQGFQVRNTVLTDEQKRIASQNLDYYL